MESTEWDYNEVLSLLAKEMGVELGNDDDDVEEENEMKYIGVKSADIYVGGRKLPSNPVTKVYCSGPIGNVNINFDDND